MYMYSSKVSRFSKQNWVINQQTCFESVSEASDWLEELVDQSAKLLIGWILVGSVSDLWVITNHVKKMAVR